MSRKLKLESIDTVKKEAFNKQKSVQQTFLGNTRNKKGITLVALVVTIIILIILATVSINIIVGENGLIRRAEQAKELSETAQNEEQKALDELYASIDNANLPENTKDTVGGTIVKLPSNWEYETSAYVSTADGSIVQSSVKTASVYAVSAGEGETVPIPKGFYYVGGTVSSGVVISDNEADQNKYATEEDVPAGVAYNADGTVNESSSVLKGNQFVWIPCTIENYTKHNFGKTNATSWDTSTNTAEEVQIKKYGGFYVARYEAGTSDIELANDVKFENGLTNASSTSSYKNGNFVSSNVQSGKITSKAGEIPYYHADYTTAVEMSKNMYDTNHITSGLMTGTMWDAMLKYIATDKTSYSDLLETSWGNYNTDTGITYTAGQGRYMTVDLSSGIETSDFTVADGEYKCGIRTTASSEDVKKNNLYDIAGNLWEWTQEHCSANLFMLRGGAFPYSPSNGPVCFRLYYDATSTDTGISFRPALYIK